FQLTDTKASPWWVVDANDKRRARLNCIHHLLSCVPYKDITSQELKLPRRQPDDYIRPPVEDQTFVPEVY
ncbi:MAG: polyphosphate kinase, partial [Actinomycetota bacterium]|nr:polyphosphate kinase [Actinomycetota bacterium]